MDRLRREILPKFQGKKVIVIGDVFIDHYISGNVERLNPEAPVPILHARDEEFRTGGAGNTAKNAAGLGAVTTLIAVVGVDKVAEQVEKVAGQEGYRAKLVRDASRPTIRKVRYLTRSQQLLRVDYEEVHDVQPTVEIELINILKNEIPGNDAIIVSDYAKGAITEKVSQAIVSTARQHNILVAADVKPSRIKSFTGASFIAPNIKEAHEYLGLNQLEQGGRKPAELARELSKIYDTDVFLTLGPDGVYIYAKDNTNVHVPQSHVINVSDVSGAGDTSVVAMTLARLAGANHLETAYISNAAGAVVVQKIGSAHLTLRELQSMLDKPAAKIPADSYSYKK